MAVPGAVIPRLNWFSGCNYDAAPAELKPQILAEALRAQAAYEARRRREETTQKAQNESRIGYARARDSAGEPPRSGKPVRYSREKTL